MSEKLDSIIDNLKQSWIRIILMFVFAVVLYLAIPLVLLVSVYYTHLRANETDS